MLTTNLAFSDWPTIFPNATCATALIDRTVHHADVIAIEGESYRRRVCFTWETKVIPTTGSRAEEMIDILQRWAHAFSVALARLYQLRDELSQP